MRQRSQLQLDWVPVDAYDKTRANAFEENARMCDTQSLHMRQHVQIANAFQANAHKENASMCDTQSFSVYETTCANAFEGNVRMYETQYFDAFKTTCANTLEKNKKNRKTQVCVTPNLQMHMTCANAQMQ